MAKKENKLKNAEIKAEFLQNMTNKRIENLGVETKNIHNELNNLQKLFDLIRNVPNDNQIKLKKLKKIRLNWKQQVKLIENNHKKATAKSIKSSAAGTSAGLAVATLGPTAAMGVATTFGVASTGTVISSLSGAAATNAALAWLGGGALSAGGGGMAAGSAFLALAGPVGWAIAGFAVISSGLFYFKAKEDKVRLDNLFTLIIERDIKSYKLAIIELNERILRIKDETKRLNEARKKAESFGLNYNQMSEAQQYELGAYVNLMYSSTQLLVNPILGLQPNYSEKDFNTFIASISNINKKIRLSSLKLLIINLANLLYKIELSIKDRKILCKVFSNNEDFISSFGASNKDITLETINYVGDALAYKYKN